jgi:hypothetical protein
MFDTLGRRYGKLPSEVLKTADSFDIMVFDVAATYENYLNKKANNKDVSDMYSQEDINAYYNKVKGHGKDNSRSQ